MKKVLKAMALVFISLFALNLHGQSVYETVYSGSSAEETYSVGAISNDRKIAISRQYVTVPKKKGRRDLRFFDVIGNLLAQSDYYSHDNYSFTKILFDPRNENVVYALYNQRKAHSYLEEPDEDAPIYHYIRRFVRNGSVVTMSEPEIVYENNNPSDFVIAPNGDLLVGNVQNNGQVNVRPVRWLGTWMFAPELMVSVPGSAKKSPGSYAEPKLWPICMDMKENIFIIAHNRGYHYNNHYIQIKKAQYNPTSQTANTIYVYPIQGKTLAHKGGNAATMTSSKFHQKVALRPDGGIMFVSRELSDYNNTTSPVNYLNSMTASGANTVLEVTNGLNTNVVVTEENKIFFAASDMVGDYKINLYSYLDDLEHTYTPAVEVTNKLYNLAVKDCDLLVAGKLNDSYQYHQFFSCSDCNGELNADGEFTGQFVDREVGTKYGPLPVAVFCSPEDVVFNGLPSTCESKVEIAIAPINVNTWVPGQDLFNGVYCDNCTAPSNIQISNYANPLNYGQYYLFTFRVIDLEGNVSVIHRLFMIEHCKEKEDSETQKLEFEVFPNPNQGEFEISVINNENKGLLEVLSLSGNVIFRDIISGENQIHVDISKVPSGVYLVKININGEVYIKRIVKN